MSKTLEDTPIGSRVSFELDGELITGTLVQHSTHFPQSVMIAWTDKKTPSKYPSAWLIGDGIHRGTIPAKYTNGWFVLKETPCKVLSKSNPGHLGFLTACIVGGTLSSLASRRKTAALQKQVSL
jgi:hypothetical protein